MSGGIGVFVIFLTRRHDSNYDITEHLGAASMSPDQSTDHPTSKPLEVFAIPMCQYTSPGGICNEPFSGSGSQPLTPVSTMTE